VYSPTHTGQSSASGALAPSVAAALSAPLTGVIFVDAILPHPGRGWLDTAPPALKAQLAAGAQQGLLPAWDGWWPPGALERLVPDAELRAAIIADLEPLPLAYFEEPAPADDLSAPCAYLQLSGAYEEEARRATRLGWPVVRLPATHLAVATQPLAVAAALGGRESGAEDEQRAEDEERGPHELHPFHAGRR